MRPSAEHRTRTEAHPYLRLVEVRQNVTIYPTIVDGDLSQGDGEVLGHGTSVVQTDLARTTDCTAGKQIRASQVSVRVSAAVHGKSHEGP